MKIIHKLLSRKSKINFNLSHQHAHESDKKTDALKFVLAHNFLKKTEIKSENKSQNIVKKKQNMRQKKLSSGS